MRIDLEPKSQIVVQSAHAVFEATNKFKPDIHPHLVVIGVKDQEALFTIQEKLTYYNVGFSLFREPDKNNELTAIATEPIAEFDSKRKLFKKYRLLDLGVLL